jgi:hypothetical protein
MGEKKIEHLISGLDEKYGYPVITQEIADRLDMRIDPTKTTGKVPRYKSQLKGVYGENVSSWGVKCLGMVASPEELDDFYIFRYNNDKDLTILVAREDLTEKPRLKHREQPRRDGRKKEKGIKGLLDKIL